MVAFRNRDDGLVEVTFDDNSKLAMLPSVLKTSGLYDPSMPEGARPEGQLAERDRGLDQFVQGGGVPGAPARPVSVPDVQPRPPVQPQAPAIDPTKGATAIPRVTIPAAGSIKGPQVNPLEAAATSKEQPRATFPVFAQAAPGGPAKFSRVKAESEGIEPTEKGEIFRGELDLEGARAGTNIQLQERAMTEEGEKRELADYLHTVADERAVRAAEAQDSRDKAQGAYNTQVKALDEQFRQLRDEPSARDKVMDSKGWFGSILAAIGLAIGSGVQAVTGTNPVRDILNDQIRDVADAQEKKAKLYGENVNRLGELRQQFKDEELARQQLELEIAEAQNARLAAFAASSDSAAVRELAQITIAQRQEEFVRRQQELRMKLANKVASTYGWRGGGGAGGAKLMVQIDDGRGGKMFVTPEQANQLMNVEEKQQSLMGNPTPTSASKRQEIQDIRATTINNPFGKGFLFMKGNDAEQIKKTREAVAAYNRLTGALNRIENTRKEILREKAPDKKATLVQRMQTDQREAAGVVSDLRIIGGYGAPTGPDLEQLDKEIGEIGQNLKGPTVFGVELPGPKWIGIMSEQVQGNIDNVRRIQSRKLKSWLNESTSTDVTNVVPPNFPLEDVPPSEGGPPGEVILKKAVPAVRGK